MADRRLYLVAWNEEAERWEIRLIRDRAEAASSGLPGRLEADRPTRREAVKVGAIIGRSNQPSQLLVKNRGNGRWSEERTYGDDPERWPG